MSTWNERHPAPLTENQALDLLVEDIKKARSLSEKKREKFFKKIARDQANYFIHRNDSTGYCKLCLTRRFHEIIVTQYNENSEVNEQLQSSNRRN